MDNTMKKIFFILFTLVAFISYGQSVLTDVNGKVITSATGDILVQEADPNNFEYTPNPEWIPVNGVADNEIWILAADNLGNRNGSITCTVQNSGQYSLDIIGGATGNVVLSTTTVNSGTKLDFQIPLGTGKYCSSGNYYTYKLRIYAQVSANAILTYTVSKHTSDTTTTNEPFKIINFGTRLITSIVSTYVITKTATYCYTPYLLYANTYYCKLLTTDYCFSDAPLMTMVTMSTEMNYLRYFGTYVVGNFVNAFGAFSNCTSLNNVKLPEMNSLICMGGYSGTGSGFAAYGSFYNCTSLTNITFPKKMNSVQYMAAWSVQNSVANVFCYGTFYGCTALTTITLPEQMSALKYFGGGILNPAGQRGTFVGCSNLETIYLPNTLTELLIFGDMYGTSSFINGCVKLKYIYGLNNFTKVSTLATAFTSNSLLSIPNCTFWNTNSIPFSAVVLNMQTFEQTALKCSSFLLTGTSNAVRSSLTYINIDWANSVFSGNIDIRYNSLSNTEIDRIFTELPTVVVSRTIYVASNVGSATCDPTIATAKNWIVITS